MTRMAHRIYRCRMPVRGFGLQQLQFYFWNRQAANLQRTAIASETAQALIQKTLSPLVGDKSR